MNKVGVAMVSGVSGKLAEPALIQFKQSLKQTQWWILASIGLLITGDIWNIALHVHTRPYTIGYHVVNGHKIFCYVESSKWWLVPVNDGNGNQKQHGGSGVGSSVIRKN